MQRAGDGTPTGARLTNPPSYEIKRFTVDGHQVLVIRVDENQPGAKPCFVTAKGLTNGSYKRVDDKGLRLSATEIFELQNLLRSAQDDRTTVPEATVDDLDSTRLDALLERQRNSKALRGVRDRKQQLNRLNVLDSDGNVWLAGLLTLGSYPQQFYPRLLVDVAIHPTIEKSSAASQLRFVDRVECEGPLAEVVDEAVGAVARNLRTYSVVEGTGRGDQLEIPREVIREAIANAVLHREYNPLFHGQPTVVDVYPDRITITNPGGLWGGKTVETLTDGVSRCRNQTLLQLLQHVPLASGAVVEGQGSGVLFMINQMAAAALEQPRYHVTADQVVLELRRHGAELPSQRQWVRAYAQRDLTRHKDVMLVMARRDGHITTARAHDTLGLDSDDARKVLRKLQSNGLLRPVGPEDYVLTDAIPEPAPADISVLNVLSRTEPLSVHEIAALTDRTVNSVRPILRRLVQDGRVTATAPPSSRRRRYLLSE